jgi:hypothetical protein
MLACFVGATGRSVRVLGDDCNLAQFVTFGVPLDSTVKLNARIAGIETTMTLCGRNGEDIEEMKAKDELPGFMNSDRVSTEREFVAASYMRAHGVVDDSAGTKKLGLCSWLSAIEFATRSTSSAIAEAGSVTLTVLPGYSLHLTRPDGGRVLLAITSSALAAPVSTPLDAPTLREVTRALGEAMGREHAPGLELDLLREYDIDRLSYQLSERGKAFVWIGKKDNAPISDIDLLTRGGKQIKQRSLFANECDPCLVCGRPIYHRHKRSCDVRSKSHIRLLPNARVCYDCSTQFYTYRCRLCGADVTLDEATLTPQRDATHMCASAPGAPSTVMRTACQAPLRRHRMWGLLELVQDKANHALVAASAPALPRYLYIGDDRATPWERMGYISRWAHSIIGRRRRRVSASIVGHIDSFADHIIETILAHLRDSIRPPSDRLIGPLLN